MAQHIYRPIGRDKDTDVFESASEKTETAPQPVKSTSLIARLWEKMKVPILVLAALSLAANAYGKGKSPCAKPKPNIVFVITDDQDLLLSSLDYQEAVQRHMVQKGTTFKKHFCTISICCPSRVSLLTGKAAHNTNVTDVKMPYGGYPKFVNEGLNDNYLPVWLQEAGYNTYYTGKLMNQHAVATYESPRVAGWNRSDFLIDPGTYRYLDGIMVLDHDKHRSIKDEYSTDVVANRSLEFLGNAIEAGKPFFLGVAPIGPHADSSVEDFGAPIPADRHKHLFPDAKVPRTANFNPLKSGDATYLKILPRLTRSQVEYSDDYYRKRLQALQAVDDLVAGLIAKLEQHPDVLANTYIIYTSDNGYHIGQHRLPPGKTCNIEEDINVPFVVRGPGIAAGKEVSFPTSHTDIVPTIFKIAGIPQHEDFDGIPIALTHQAQKTQKVKAEHVNIEFWGTGYVEGTVFDDIVDIMSPNTYKTVRVVAEDYDFMYAVWCTNEHTLYDMKVDPHQLHNLYGKRGKTSGLDIGAVTSRLDTLLLTLKSCKGKVCREPWQTLFPNGHVDSLADALHPKYNSFFKTQEHVSFSACKTGYLTDFEGALAPRIYRSGEPPRFKARWEDWV